MATTPKAGRVSRHGGHVVILLGVCVMLLGVFRTSTASRAAADAPPNDNKVYVCKYVGTPGVDERRQTGDNPVWVSESATPDPEADGVQVGDRFGDRHDHSLVIQIGGTDPGIDACPVPP